MSQLKVPQHIVIIPDGNRRWAKKKGLKALEGHYHSASHEKVMELFKECKRLEIKYLTFWGFSTENWERDRSEINGLFELILKKAKKFRKDAKENQIRFRHLGRKDRLPKKLVHELEKLEEETKGFDKFSVQICLDYGGRDEIIRAINKILKDGRKEINEKEFYDYLDSSDILDPDLIIRTSGEKRTSGFMPFQSAYSELCFVDVHFPDFGPKELRKSVKDFAERKRNFGK